MGSPHEPAPPPPPMQARVHVEDAASRTYRFRGADGKMRFVTFARTPGPAGLDVRTESMPLDVLVECLRDVIRRPLGVTAEDEAFFEKTQQLRDAVQQGGVPAFLTRNLLEIAAYYGVAPGDRPAAVVIDEVMARSGLSLYCERCMRFVRECRCAG